ncbi:MAG: acyl-CoA dehydrogenase family protein, partial [Dehalococcoidia bacterium]|nr:acyl-CoA dehydrogenase family protein [Dehalococcoidia bacterium]
MDFRFPPDAEAFRQEVRQFMETELTPEIRDEYAHCTDYPHGFNKAFSRKLGAKGWLTITWPKEYGGMGKDVWHRLVFDEEMARYHAPVAAHQVSANFVGPAMIHYGTEAQKAKYLPPIARGETTWAVGMTEANAGTDLAAIETRAVRDGDEWVINGNKMYTEHIQDADYLWALVRTDPNAERHRGISIFVIDMTTPGIQLLPLWTMDGYRVNQVYFEDVRVPADAVLGELNRGFYHLAMTLNTMRSAGLGAWTELEGDLMNLVRYAMRTTENGRPLIDDDWVQHGIADYAVYIRIAKLLAYRVADKLSNGGPAPDRETSMRQVWTKHYGQIHIKFA